MPERIPATSSTSRMAADRGALDRMGANRMDSHRGGGGGRIRVLFVDDNAALIEALRVRLDRESDLTAVGHLPTADALLQEVERVQPDLVVLDIDMPGRNPLDALEELSEAHPDVRTVILSGYVREDYINRALDAGAWGYIAKSEEPDSIIDTLRRVAAGQFSFGTEVTRHLRRPAGT